MDFHSSTYGFFLAAVFCLFWLVRSRRGARVLLLLGASWFFYASWNAKYLSLILFSTLLDYFAGMALGKLDPTDPSLRKKRRLVLLASLVGNLGCLGIFKYYNFFRANIEALLAGAGIHIPHLDVILPVGISFYTFQTLSYTIEIYKGTLKPVKSFKDFALFVAFFPQLVAGPIVRARDFLPQIGKRPALLPEDFKRGLFRIALGLAKKVLVADVLAVEIVDKAFRHGSSIHGAEALFAVYAYALQIYCDFSGYSDIAIGSALLLGFRIPENFNLPYLASNIREFWRRWHISLSTWLRDYLYIPLGGNRKGRARTYLNLMITMLLGGLWHGSSWSFVAWGGIHGTWLAADRWWQEKGLPAPPGKWGRFLSVLFTFHLVCLGWVFFRSNDFGLAMDMLGRIGKGWSFPRLSTAAWLALALGAATHLAGGKPRSWAQRAWIAAPAPLIGLFWALFLGLLASAKGTSVPFIYFQF